MGSVVQVMRMTGGRRLDRTSSVIHLLGSCNWGFSPLILTVRRSCNWDVFSILESASSVFLNPCCMYFCLQSIWWTKLVVYAMSSSPAPKHVWPSHLLQRIFPCIWFCQQRCPTFFSKDNDSVLSFSRVSSSQDGFGVLEFGCSWFLKLMGLSYFLMFWTLGLSLIWLFVHLFVGLRPW